MFEAANRFYFFFPSQVEEEANGKECLVCFELSSEFLKIFRFAGIQILLEFINFLFGILRETLKLATKINKKLKFERV